MARRKAAVVAAVSSGVISPEEACRRYQMSQEEFHAWQCAFETYGVKGLHANSLQQRREVLFAPASKPTSPAENTVQQRLGRVSKRESSGSSVYASSLPEKRCARTGTVAAAIGGQQAMTWTGKPAPWFAAGPAAVAAFRRLGPSVS